MCSEPKPASGGKICITSQGDNLDSTVDSRFGRCQYFIIIDTESDGFEAVKNSHMESMSGSGIQSGQFISEKEVKTVLTGNVGPNAYQTLISAGVSIITGVSGKVSEVIEKYKNGEFTSTDGPNVDSHFGMKK